MIKLAVSYQDKISVIWALLLFLLWTIFIIDPNINVNILLHLFFVLECDLKSSMSKPLNIKLSLQLILDKRFCI